MKSSFSSKVKSKLCNIVSDSCCQMAEVLGILLFAHRFNKDEISLQTENKDVILRFSQMLKSCFDVDATITCSNPKKSNKIYTATIENFKDRERIIDYFTINKGENLIDKFLIESCCSASFVRGAFLSSGTLVNPQKYYHLELLCTSPDSCNLLSNVLKQYNIIPKITKRKESLVLYLKESEQIEDFLTLIGTSETSLEIMNIKVYKDFRNRANRVTNCETANISKVVDAALAQAEAIRLIEKNIGLDALPDDLRQIAKLRVKHMDLSLRELGQMLSPPLSRSGVYHRLQKIIKMSKEIND